MTIRNCRKTRKSRKNQKKVGKSEMVIKSEKVGEFKKKKVGKSGKHRKVKKH